MTSAKVAEFLRVRDRALARGDNGVIRSMNFELRRLGVPDDATAAHPAGKPSKGRRTRETAVSAPKAKPRQMRCEHENMADRCEICNPELAAR